MNKQDLRRAFSAIDPTRDLDDDALEEIFPRAVLTQRIYEGITKRRPIASRRSSRFLRRSVVVPLVLVLLAGGTAAAVSLLRTPAPVRLSALMACYSQPSLTAGVIAVTDLTSTPGRTCVQQLTTNNKSDSTPRTWDPSQFNPPVLCVGGTGDLKVFPRGRAKNLCNTLRLSPFSGKVVVDHVSRFTQSVEHLARANTCLAFSEAKANVQALLRTNGLGETWKIVLDNHSSSSKSCASFGFDDRKRIVYVVGL